MKTLLFSLVFLLGGCALMPTPFDSALYDHLVKMSVIADYMQDRCGTDSMLSDTKILKIESNIVAKYTEFTSKDTHSPIVLVNKNIIELNNAYEKGVPSTAYCKLKLKIIGEDLHLILIAIGGKNK